VEEDECLIVGASCGQLNSLFRNNGQVLVKADGSREAISLSRQQLHFVSDEIRAVL